MSRNEKIIMGALIGGILIFLVLSIVLLVSQGRKPASLPTSQGGTIEEGEIVPTIVAYPTIAPVENMTVMMNNRQFVPESFKIPKGGFVDFFNISDQPITIEANDQKSSILNTVGVVQPSEIKGIVFETPGTYIYRSKENPTQVGVIEISE